MWEHRYITKIDFKLVFIIFVLMIISLFVISSMTDPVEKDSFYTPYVKNQIQWFILGWVIFVFFAGFDYRKLYSWTWILYILMIFLLLGLFFARSIQSVHRWYRLPLIGMSVQPSEYAKLIVVLSLGWFLEKKQFQIDQFGPAMQLLLIVIIPFLLILKQPDLGTALILFPITLTMCYFGNVHKKTVYFMTVFTIIGMFFVTLLFSNVISHEKMKPFFLTFMKEYQYERLKPNWHQKAAQTSIAIGGLKGSGWRKSEFSSQKWLPAAHTDSVFAAYSEEFGLIGVIFLLFIFYLLVHISFQVVKNAKDYYGRLLASGIAVYLAMHIIVNMGMMCGYLPISGVPLILITYGGNSTLTTMGALGILQSIYSRRYRF